MRILQLTDLHIFADNEQTLRGIPTRQTFRDVVQMIRDEQEEFDLLIITGDHTHDEQSESYAFVADQLADWHDRMLVVPGNHDDRQILRESFSSILAKPGVEHSATSIRFCKQAAGWNLIGIDSHLPGEVPGRVESEQCAWLEKTLQEHSDSPTAIFMHHPPVPVGSVWMDSIGLQSPEEFQSVIRENAQVQLIVCGHVHHEWRGALGQATVVSTPSTGIQFDPDGDVPTFAADAPGYRVINLSNDSWLSAVKRLPLVEFVPDA